MSVKLHTIPATQPIAVKISTHKAAPGTDTCLEYDKLASKISALIKEELVARRTAECGVSIRIKFLEFGDETIAWFWPTSWTHSFKEALKLATALSSRTCARGQTHLHFSWW